MVRLARLPGQAGVAPGGRGCRGIRRPGWRCRPKTGACGAGAALRPGYRTAGTFGGMNEGIAWAGVRLRPVIRYRSGDVTVAVVAAIPRWVHPRVCGEAGDSYLDVDDGGGPSPRVRGSPGPDFREEFAVGSIPACAGKPQSYLAKQMQTRVHPRVCGEARGQFVKAAQHMGPSPRVRGSLQSGDQGQPGDGSIPACAGKPPAGVRSPPAPRVHPRVCGEARAVGCRGLGASGPSPRVRGSQPPESSPCSASGSIPACAGKPAVGVVQARVIRVHPRVCGEAWVTQLAGSFVKGPSPRVRGSLLPSSPIVPRLGSIPACAGKPRIPRTAPRGSGVHPRVCGEASVKLLTGSPSRFNCQ